MEQYQRLKKELLTYKKICIAYSGGVDSDFLLNAAVDALGCENVLAIIARGVMMSEKDWKEAGTLATRSKAKWMYLDIDPLSIKEFAFNDKKRCYYCKKMLMSKIKDKANQLDFSIVADGQNGDDLTVYRPGSQAAEELGIISPLSKTGYHKNEIRRDAKAIHLLTWNKLSNSCLATRFPYQTQLTKELLKKVENAEYLLNENGFQGVRVRLHGDIARIELSPDHFSSLLEKKELIQNIKSLGFGFITLDLEGFRSGSMD